MDSSYSRYKVATTLVFEWILTTAKALPSPDTSKNGVRQIVHLATRCAEHGRKMPKDTIALLEEALLLRQRFSKWFADNCPDSIRSNKNHAFFNSQLEQILNLFRLPSPSLSTSTGTIHSNRFSVLQQDTNLTDIPEIDANTKAPRSQAVNINTEDPICVPFEDGHLFELFCLFHDANEIRTYLAGIRRRYKDRKVDLITASLTTQVAFRRFIDQEVAFAQKYPSLEYLGFMIGSVYTYMATGESSLWTGTPEAVESKKVKILSALKKLESQLDKWTFRSTSVILEQMAVLGQMEVLGNREQRDQLLMELLTPKYDRYEGDFRRLLDFFDATPTEQVKSPVSPLGHLDPLVFRFRQPPVGGRIHLSTALMCRVFLDISGQEVSDIAMADGRTLKGYVDAQKRYINPDGQTRLQKIIDLLETPVAALHPAVAGTAVFRMLYNIQSLTVNVENASWRLMSAAHLYNWFRVLNIGFPRWPDMEKMIDLQQVEIFAASEPPQTSENCCKRFWMARGLKLEDIQKHSATDTLEEAASKRFVPLIQYHKIKEKTSLTLERDLDLLELHKKKRNTPGWRRELLLAPFLEKLDETYEDKTRPWSLPWEAVKTAISKQRGTPGVQLSVRCPPLIPYLELVERAIQSEVPLLVFDFPGVREAASSLVFLGNISPESVAKTMSNDAHRPPFRWPIDSEFPDKKSLAWQSLCREMAMFVPPGERR